MGARVEAREGRFPPFTVRGAELHGDRLRAARGQRPGQVVRADRRDARRRLDHRHGAGAEPRPHRAPAAPRARAVRARRPDDRPSPRSTSSSWTRSSCRATRRRRRSSSRRRCSCPGSRVVVKDMGLNWTRTGFFRIAERMGGGDRRRPRGARHRGRRRAGRRARRGLAAARGHRRSSPDEVPLAIDELTLVALLGAFAEGETVVRGAEELRLKESDRIAAVVDGLSGLGADIEATAGRLRGPRRRLAAARAARSTPAATTAWRCSARWPGWPRARAWRCSGMEAAGGVLPRLRAGPRRRSPEPPAK